jgi:hypothetical protein
MKKLVLAAAVSAVFAAPCAAWAQAAAPAVPTLDKVLEASGISVSGYIDSAYTHADHDIQAGIGGIAPRVFDNQNNSFGLHQFGLTVAKQPKEGFGAVINLTAGTDAQIIHSFPENNPAVTATNTSTFDVTQAYAQYAGGPLTVMMGKYATMHGTEVIASTGNTNFSRSILFGAEPFTHTGVRLTYAASDAVSLTAGVNNGWDQLSDSNKGKTLELGATLTPVKPLTVVLSAMSGNEPVSTTVNGNRTSLNAVGTYTATDALSIGLEYLSVTQDNFTSLVGAGTISAKYSGEALYVTYMFNPKWRGVLRAEQFSDKDGFHFGVADAKYNETTLTVAYLPTASFELRGEVRSDRADKAVYREYGSATNGKSFTTLALEALYKF